MNQSYFREMEQEIEKEEAQQDENASLSKMPGSLPKNTYQKIKNTVLAIKKPKIITLIILLLTILTIYAAMSLISKKQPDQLVQMTTSEVSAPSPKSVVNPAIESLNKNLENYSKKLNSLTNFDEKLNEPIVDLEISF